MCCDFVLLSSSCAPFIASFFGRELEEKLLKQHKEAARRENTLVHRLTTKEQELQDYLVSLDSLIIVLSS
jgi:hypothetical protein